MFNTTTITAPTFPDEFRRLSNASGILTMSFFPDIIVKPGITINTANPSINTNFINPQKDNIEILANLTQNIYTLCSLTAALLSIATAANNAAAEVSNFSIHTGRISGSISVESEELIQPEKNRPHLVTLSSMGKMNNYFSYIKTGSYNSNVMVESYGSLYINLTNNVATLNAYSHEIAGNLEFVVGEGGGFWTTNLTSERITQITSNVNSVKDFIYNSRLSDENYFTGFSESSKSGQSFSLYTLVNEMVSNIITTYSSSLTSNT